MNEIRAQLSATSRDKWIRHLRVLDAKEDGATHAEIFLRFADEGLVTETADSQPNAVVSQWITQANEVMEKVARFL